MQDMTNPYLPRPDGGANGIPKAEMPPGGPAAVLYHKQKLVCRGEAPTLRPHQQMIRQPWCCAPIHAFAPSSRPPPGQGDDSVKWCTGFKHVLWGIITPYGSAKGAQADGVETCGDKEAVDVMKDICVKSGWRPVVRGDLSVAPTYESMGPAAAPMDSPQMMQRFMGDKLACF